MPMRPPAPVRPPPLIRHSSHGGPPGLPPLPRLRLGAPRPMGGRMPHIQQNPLASMFNMLPHPHMGPIVHGAPPQRGFCPPPQRHQNHHMNQMRPGMRPHHMNNGNSVSHSHPSIIRPPQRPPQKRTTQRMPFNHNLMIPQEPLPPMISPKGPKGPMPKGPNGTLGQKKQPPVSIPCPPPVQVPAPIPDPVPIQTKTLPIQAKPVQVPPHLNR